MQKLVDALAVGPGVFRGVPGFVCVGVCQPAAAYGYLGAVECPRGARACRPPRPSASSPQARRIGPLCMHAWGRLLDAHLMPTTQLREKEVEASPSSRMDWEWRGWWRGGERGAGHFSAEAAGCNEASSNQRAGWRHSPCSPKTGLSGCSRAKKARPRSAALPAACAHARPRRPLPPAAARRPSWV
jgi:hypothetical protein